MPTSTYFVLLALVIYNVTTASARKVNIKINLGGNAVDGFSAEEEFLQVPEEAVQTRYHGEIKGSGEDLKVFQTQRFTREEDLVFKVPVPDGIYAVTLMFAETWQGAFNAGKRVFDVYLGSKPGGVIKVAENLDPFRVGGPAGPVRKKYYGIATYDGLTVALRPVKQNPQIAGIVISGFSYSESLIDELPTVTGDVSEVEDFSVLSNIGPRLPVDLSIVYDPALNPKFKDKNGALLAGSPGTANFPHQTTVPTSSTFTNTQQSLFTSQGRPSGSVASQPSFPLDATTQKPPLSSQLAYGNNPSSGRPVPQLLTSPGSGSSPRYGLRAGTVRLAVEKAGPSDSPPDRKRKPVAARKHQSKSSNAMPSAKWGRRHGRHLASIPAEIEEKSLLPESGSTESNIPNQSTFASPSLDHPSSYYLSRPLQQGLSARKYSDYSTSTQGADKQAFSDRQTSEYIQPLDMGKTWNAPQHELGTAIADQQNQHRGEVTRALYQAQTESVTTSSALSPQTRASPESAYLDSITQAPSQTKSTTDPMKPAFYEPTSRVHLQEPLSETSGIQEPAGPAFHSQIEEYPTIPPSGFPGLRSQGQTHRQPENVQQRKAATSPVHMDVRNSRGGNGLGSIGEVKDLDSVTSSNRFDSPKGIAYQEAFDESFRSSPVTHSRNSVGNPLQSSSQGSLRNSHPHPLGMNAVSVDNLASSPPQESIGRQNAVDNDMPGFMEKVTAGSTEPTWQSVRAFLGTDEVDRNTPDVPKSEAGGREHYQAISSRSMGSMPAEHVSENPASSNLRSTDSRTESMMSFNVAPPGVHNGNGKLDGMCIDNSTHCSCGMVEQMADSPEECLFVVDEKVNPMICITRPCSGKVVCACAPGASTLCQRSVAKTILVRASATILEGTEDPTLVACKRETLEHGIVILTPII